MVKIQNRVVGPGEPVFVTFEAGPTHDGLESAQALVREAAKAGADAVKFQIFDPDRLVADKAQLFTYEVLADRVSGRRETVSEPLYDLLCRRCLTEAEWRAVKATADEVGLAFFATVGFAEDITLLRQLDCHSIKIASADVNHVPLLKLAAKTDMVVQLDTGNSTLGEMEAAVDLLEREGAAGIIIHHCPSGYPARADGVNLNVLPTLKRMFPRCGVAFSDHSTGWDMDVAAVVLGAELVEKTITFDRTTRSVEHIMSLEPSEMSAFVKVMRDLKVALGQPRRIMTEAERQRSMAVRRSVFIKNDVPAGATVQADDLDYRRPGFGLPPAEGERVAGRTAARDLKAGELVDWTMLA